MKPSTASSTPAEEAFVGRLVGGIRRKWGRGVEEKYDTCRRVCTVDADQLEVAVDIKCATIVPPQGGIR